MNAIDCRLEEITAELHSLQLSAKENAYKLDNWLASNSQASKEGQPPAVNSSLLDWQRGLLFRINGRIVSLSLSLAALSPVARKP